jgi:hypothetical protein
MNKKLLVILVVVAAMLISFSLLMAAKAPIKGPVEKYVKQAFTHQQSATTMPEAPAINKQAATVEATGRPQKGLPSHVSLSGTPVRMGAPSGKDLCNLMGAAAWFVGDWIYGLEYYANYQDPEEFGCTAVWPFQVTEIDFQLNFPAEWVEMDVSVQGFIFADAGTPSCPLPEATPGFINACSTAVFTYTIPAGGGYFELPMPLTEECCVYAPYFAVVYISTDLSGLSVDMVSEDNATAFCRSYNDYGTGWIDLVQSVGFPGPLMLYTQGYTSPQNNCPTQGDTCGVTSVTPPTIQVLAGGTANFTANVYFQGAQTSCMLTVTPDPACPTCVTTITPNPVDTPATSATITIVTDPSTPPGTYAIDCGGAKASATLIVLAPNDSCEVARYISAPGYYFSGWSAGDQNAILLDPAMCTACGPNVYPFHIQMVNSRWVNWTGTSTSLDVIFHIYEAPTPYCDGPGVEIYQFPATITAWSPTYVAVPLPDVICVDGPFWLAAEYVSCTPADDFPALRMSNQTYADTCTQFNYYGGAWYEWADFWTPPPPGYFYLSAIGSCQGVDCPITCDMQQDNGAPQSFFSSFASGDKVAKYYDPEEYCAPPVYPYRIHDVDLAMYNPTGTPAVDVQIGIYLECQVPCDGPGTQIYLSPTFTLNPPSGISMQHIVLPEPICIYEPFFVALEYASGTAGTTPSILFDNKTIPMDTCHGWMYYQPYSPPWIEWSDFWTLPAPGRPMIRISGFTNDPACEPEPCDTTLRALDTLRTRVYLWRNPSRYGDTWQAQRFQMPGDFGGRLDEFKIAFYATGSTGTPNPDFYVWLSDGVYPLDNNPPYQAIADFHITYADIVFHPGTTTVTTWQRGVEFDPSEMFHIGWGHAFTPGDTLRSMSDDGSYNSDRSAEWTGGTGPWGTMLDDWGLGLNFEIYAYMCLGPQISATFSMKCTPAKAFGTPGDPPTNKYKVELSPLVGYNLPVTLSLLSVSPSPAPGNIFAAFVPNGVAPPCTSDAAITVAPNTPYGDYTLTFQGVGTDAQTKTCNVTLTVQPPYDQGVVHFNHGTQGTSNFGALGSDASTDNFVWYGTNYLFDGSFVSAVEGTPQNEHFALDVYDCSHVGFIPTQHMVITHDPWCPGSPYEEYYGEVAYSNFYTEEDVISCEYDSVFIIGLSDVTCTDFSIKIKIYYNPTPTPIPLLHFGLYEDWDVGDAYNNWGDMDTLHNLMYQFDPVDPSLVFGMMKAPFYNGLMHNMVFVRNPIYVWPNAGFCSATGGFEGLDSLYALMSRPGFVYPEMPDTDMSMLMCPPPMTLNPGDKHIEVWIDFGRNTADGMTWQQWYHKILRYAGFYRGDVDASDTLELPALDVSDLVYLLNYLYDNGPEPVPFVDQADVNASGPYGVCNCTALDFNCPRNNVDVADLVYLINYVFKNGPAPLDRVRFIEQCWTRPSLFTEPLWQ